MLAFTLTEAYQLTHQEGKVNLRLVIVHTYKRCGSLRETARKLSISRNTVRKWVRRYIEEGEAGLKDRSRRPRRCPRRTPPEVEEEVLSLHHERGRGRRWIAHTFGRGAEKEVETEDLAVSRWGHLRGAGKGNRETDGVIKP